MTINKAILIGNVGRDPEIRTMQSGDKIANISLATSENWKDRASGEWKNKSEWHRIVVFNPNLSEMIEKHVQKGTRLYVEGQIQTRKWEKDGVERYATEIVLQKFGGTIKILSAKEGNDDSVPVSSQDLDDEIPF